jgi:hypothetical protein
MQNPLIYFFRRLKTTFVNIVSSKADQWLNEWNELQAHTVYPKVSGLAAWSENCKWYSYLPLNAVTLLFCESV